MLPRQSQLWAVLHASDTNDRLLYSLVSTFLGRMCLSGDIDSLSPEQWEQVLAAQRLYVVCANIIKHGTSRIHQHIGPSWRRPLGWQAVVRTSADGMSKLVVVHAFGEQPDVGVVPLGDNSSEWTIANHFGSGSASIEGTNLNQSFSGPFTAAVYWVKVQ
jgi:alpha-galactosidase